MVHYKPIKITIDAPSFAEVIIDIVVRYHGLLNSIITDWGSLFISKFWSLLCYFLGIKKRLSTTFHPKINDQTKRQNSIMKAYLKAFVNWEQNDRAHLLLMTEFKYNNAKNASTSHMPFILNCSFYLQISLKDNVNPCFRSCSTNKLAKEARELIDICQQNLLHAQNSRKEHMIKA